MSASHSRSTHLSGHEGHDGRSSVERIKEVLSQPCSLQQESRATEAPNRHPPEEVAGSPNMDPVQSNTRKRKRVFSRSPDSRRHHVNWNESQMVDSGTEASDTQPAGTSNPAELPDTQMVDQIIDTEPPSATPSSPVLPSLTITPPSDAPSVSAATNTASSPSEHIELHTAQNVALEAGNGDLATTNILYVTDSPHEALASHNGVSDATSPSSSGTVSAADEASWPPMDTGADFPLYDGSESSTSSRTATPASSIDSHITRWDNVPRENLRIRTVAPILHSPSEIPFQIQYDNLRFFATVMLDIPQLEYIIITMDLLRGMEIGRPRPPEREEYMQGYHALGTINFSDQTIPLPGREAVLIIRNTLDVRSPTVLMYEQVLLTMYIMRRQQVPTIERNSGTNDDDDDTDNDNESAGGGSDRNDDVDVNEDDDTRARDGSAESANVVNGWGRGHNGVAQLQLSPAESEMAARKLKKRILLSWALRGYNIQVYGMRCLRSSRYGFWNTFDDVELVPDLGGLWKISQQAYQSNLIDVSVGIANQGLTLQWQSLCPVRRPCLKRPSTLREDRSLPAKKVHFSHIEMPYGHISAHEHIFRCDLALRYPRHSERCCLPYYLQKQHAIVLKVICNKILRIERRVGQGKMYRRRTIAANLHAAERIYRLRTIEKTPWNEPPPHRRKQEFAENVEIRQFRYCPSSRDPGSADRIMVNYDISSKPTKTRSNHITMASRPPGSRHMWPRAQTPEPESPPQARAAQSFAQGQTTHFSSQVPAAQPLGQSQPAQYFAQTQPAQPYAHAQAMRSYTQARAMPPFTQSQAAQQSTQAQAAYYAAYARQVEAAYLAAWARVQPQAHAMPAMGPITGARTAQSASSPATAPSSCEPDFERERRLMATLRQANGRHR